MTTPALSLADPAFSAGWRTVLGTGLMSTPDRWTYEQLERYHTGQQALSFLSPEVSRAVRGRLRTLVVNWPRLVIGSLDELLDVEGFRTAQDAPADDGLWGIWQANRLDVGSQLCHLEALIHGRAYVLVWADETDGEHPRITVESPQQMSVRFDASGTTVTQAVKRWYEDDLAYATLYLPDRVERYVADAGVMLETTDVLAQAAAWKLREEPISHDLGQVPVVPFVNRPSLTRPYGESELADVIPLTDAINKLGTDMMVSAEYHAMPRRWATGVDLGPVTNPEQAAEIVRQQWTEAAAGRVWMSDSPNARMGQFTEASLDNYVHGIQLLESQLAAIAGLPPEQLGLNPQGNPASADAIRARESTRVRRAQRKQRGFGESWEDVMRLALIVRDGHPMAGAERMETMWRDPNTPTIAQKVDAAVKLDGIGMPHRQTFEDLGYTPVQIDRINTMATTDSLSRVMEQLTAVDRIVKQFGLSRAAALAIVGLEQAAQWEAKVEAKQPALASELGGGDLSPPVPAAPPAAGP